MTTTNDPTAAAAELRKQAQLKRDVAARTLERCRNLSLPADLRGAEESDARDDLAEIYGISPAEVWVCLKAMRKDGEVTTSEGVWRLTAEGMTRAGERLGEVA